ncbi:iron-containing alcohol dehydrogenase [Hyphomicrobiales bacterium]|nr:iron-containing alcohol dehydrogenase [Hyphomicrobiales bacterium]MDA9904812.1 iron-containing alcohol dehydrogenase [Hyphomicrobiales bacterium]
MENTYTYSPLDRVIWDTQATDAILNEVERLNVNKAYIVASSTLSKKTDEISKIKNILGNKFVGLFDSCIQHSPLENVIDCVKSVQEKNPDIIITVGGGTPIDTVKVVQLCHSLEINTVDDLKKISNKHQNKASKIRQIAVPTTLSGGEYSIIGGAMDTKTQLKERYTGSDICPQVVILDPSLTLHTPDWLWLSTAIRSVDHAVEGLCSSSTNPLMPPMALNSLQLFARSLRETFKDREDIFPRSLSQKAVWMIAKNLGNTSMGASHGIGYLLGSIGSVPHGYTSCVMLPAVLKWNESFNKEKQKWISNALGRPKLSAAEAVGELVSDLGLPTTLGEVGIKDDQWDKIADYGLKHPTVLSNPRPITKKDDIIEILKLAS